RRLRSGRAPVAQRKSDGLLSRWSEVRILPGACAGRDSAAPRALFEAEDDPFGGGRSGSAADVPFMQFSARTTAIVAALSALALALPAAGVAAPKRSNLTSWKALATPAAKTAPAARSSATAALEAEVLTGLNGVRTQRGLKPLRRSA